MRVLRGILQHSRTRWPEWCLAWVLFMQSAWLLHGRFLHQAAAYKLMFQMADTRALTAVGCCIGALWVVALVINGTFVRFRRISPWLRVITGTAASCYWTMWAVTLYQSSTNVNSNAWINHAGYALMAATCVLMAADEVAHADKKAGQWKRMQKRRTGGL